MFAKNRLQLFPQTRRH